jgi:adenine-specific DNA methylase
MAVLHITYKYNPQTSRANFYGFYQVITSYRWARLSDSNWAITADEPPQAVWQKLKQYIDPSDYFLMMPLDPTSFSAKDRTVLSWLAAGP